MTPAQQLKKCQNGWSAFTTRQERAAKAKWLRWAAGVCRKRADEACRLSIDRALRDAANAIEAEIPPTQDGPVTSELV